MSREIERRIILSEVEHRAKPSSTGTLVGYAALYDTVSEDLGGFREVLRPGCFDRAIRENHDVLARAEHDSRLLLGRSSSGTLRLSVDAKGLKYEVDLPDTAAGRDVAELVRRGDVRQSSFAFMVTDPDCVRWVIAEDGAALREVLDLDLIDVAPVAMPAYAETSVSARALEQARSMNTQNVMKPEAAPVQPVVEDAPVPSEPVAEASAETEERAAHNRLRLRMQGL